MIRLLICFLVVSLGGCGQSAPSERSAAPPIAPLPSRTVDVAAAELQIGGPIEWCGSLGGCAYYAALDGPDQTWQGTLEVVPGDSGLEIGGNVGLPPTLPAGRYALALWSRPVSDAIANGVRQTGPIAAMCSVKFSVSPGQRAVAIAATFDWVTCSAVLSDSPATSTTMKPDRFGQPPYDPPRPGEPGYAPPDTSGDVTCPNTEPCGP
jgi:hypothetical protein